MESDKNDITHKNQGNDREQWKLETKNPRGIEAWISIANKDTVVLTTDSERPYCYRTGISVFEVELDNFVACISHEASTSICCMLT